MGRAFGAVAWVVVGALIGAFVGVMVGLLAGGMIVGVTKPQGGGGTTDVIGSLVWAIACGTSTVIGGLAGAAGGMVWGTTPDRPRSRFEEDRPAFRDREY